MRNIDPDSYIKARQQDLLALPWHISASPPNSIALPDIYIPAEGLTESQIRLLNEMTRYEFLTKDSTGDESRYVFSKAEEEPENDSRLLYLAPLNDIIAKFFIQKNVKTLSELQWEFSRGVKENDPVHAFVSLDHVIKSDAIETLSRLGVLAKTDPEQLYVLVEPINSPASNSSDSHSFLWQKVIVQNYWQVAEKLSGLLLKIPVCRGDIISPKLPREINLAEKGYNMGILDYDITRFLDGKYNSSAPPYRFSELYKKLAIENKSKAFFKAMDGTSWGR